MTISPYNQETCQTFSSFQAPHQPCYGQLMFNHVQLGYGWPGRLPYVKLIIQNWLELEVSC